jgi:hypothetical protein
MTVAICGLLNIVCDGISISSGVRHLSAGWSNAPVTMRRIHGNAKICCEAD